jgi:hypothetical protein
MKISVTTEAILVSLLIRCQIFLLQLNVYTLIVHRFHAYNDDSAIGSNENAFDKNGRSHKTIISVSYKPLLQKLTE